MKIKFFSFALSAMALGLLASCSNTVENIDVPEPTPGEELPAMQLAAAPKLVIWSGNATLAGTRAEAGATRATTKYDNDEVEVNLAIEDVHLNVNGETKYEIEDLVSHLSIHVRSNTDVKVVLPVEEKWYCDQDDLYIYDERGLKEENWEVDYETLHQATATIGGQEVVLKVEYGKEDITITTEGINALALSAANETNGDGINFDVYNYYNRGNQYTTGSYAEWTVAGLSEALNKSEIEFVDNSEYNTEIDGYAWNLPDYYINAISDAKVKYAQAEGEEDVNTDCKVVPVEQIDGFIVPEKEQFVRTVTVEGVEVNYYNWVYVNKTSFPWADQDEDEDEPEVVPEGN